MIASPNDKGEKVTRLVLAFMHAQGGLPDKELERHHPQRPHVHRLLQHATHVRENKHRNFKGTPWGLVYTFQSAMFVTTRPIRILGFDTYMPR